MKSYKELAAEALERFMAAEITPDVGQLADAYMAFAERDTETPEEIRAAAYRKVAEKLETAMVEAPADGIMGLVFPYIAARQKSEGMAPGEREANMFHVTPGEEKPTVKQVLVCKDGRPSFEERPI